MPLSDDFWEDDNAAKSPWTEADLPAKSHPDTMPWAFIDFEVGGIHVASVSGIPRNRASVCRIAVGEGEDTETWSSCKTCWAWLKTLRMAQARAPAKNPDDPPPPG